MIKNPRQLCSADGCREVATWGPVAAERCIHHRVAGDMCLLEKACALCGTLTPPSADGQCPDCREFPRVRRFRMAKQERVKEALAAAGMTWESYDKIVDGGACGRERPDFVFRGLALNVVVEVDENQHRLYQCEQARMWNIAQALGGPTIFVRYNPDKYRRALAGGGLAKQMAENEKEAARHEMLVQWVKHLIAMEPGEMPFLQTVKLFYDGYIKPAQLVPVEEPTALA